MSKNNSSPILKVRGLKTYFPLRGGMFSRIKAYVRAVDGVDLEVPRGKTVGLVGESGSGKTTVGRSILRLVEPSAGRVEFDGIDVRNMAGRKLRSMRKRMQLIFQDPVGSLDPRMTVGRIVGEPLKVHSSMWSRQRRRRVSELLEKVGLSGDYVNRYPHEFSGGQRQRIGIARALASDPDFIICDEPVSALDVSIQAQILNLLKDLQREMGLSYLFIAHNLAVVEHFADIVAVMYLGRIVEIADRNDLYANPTHPYTKALLSSVPKPLPGKHEQRIRLLGEVPSPVNPPTGCPFHPRCPLTREIAAKAPAHDVARIRTPLESFDVIARCTTETPRLIERQDNSSHCHACLLVDSSASEQ